MRKYLSNKFIFSFLLFLSFDSLFSQEQILTDIDGEAAGDYSAYKVAISANGTRVAIGAESNIGSQSGLSYLSFDGVNDYVQVKREVQDDFTIQAWVKTETSFNTSTGSNFYSGNGIVYADWPGSGNDFGTSILNGKFAFGTGSLTGGDKTIQSTTSIDNNQWNHVVATREKSTGIISVYVNGTLEESLATGNSQSLTSQSILYIGANKLDGRHFKGGLREVAVWTSLISSDGVAALYNSGTPLNLLSDAGNYVSSSSLQGYWKFNDGSGSTAADASTSNNNGVIDGASWEGSSAGSGHVRVYDYSASGWVQVGSDIDGEGENDLFGYSVSLSSDGTRLAVGADNNDGNAIDAGHVRVYDYTASGWSQICSDIDGEAQADKSGYVVSLSGDGARVAIGARYNDDGGNNAGHVRVYEVSSCSQVGSDLDGAAANDWFGSSVSFSTDGSKLAIGSPNFDGNGSNAGRVYIYEYSNNSWSLIGSAIDGETAGDTFGESVSINSAGDRVAVGAPENGAGHVKIFQYNAGSWTQLGSDIDGESAGDKFGYATSFDLDGDHVAIGGYGNDGTALNAGHARVYKYIDGDWNPVGLDLEGEAGGDLFGWGLALDADGDRVVVGGPANDGSGNDAGHARVYDPFDRIQPSIVITAAEGVDGFKSADAHLSLTFTISEATSSFIEPDITVSNGSLSAFTKVSSTVYTAKLTPIKGGEVTIDVAENAFLDLFTNFNIAADQFNWFYDVDPPEIVFDPLNGSVGVALNTIITLTFNEPIRHVNNNEITNTSVDALLRLKTPIHSGTDIPFEATIDADKKVITIDPSNNFEYAQTMWVGIGESVEDSLNNAIFSAAASFVTTDTNRAPVLFEIADQITLEDLPVNLILSATDLDNDLISFAATSSEPNVTPQITDSLLTLTPALNWHGVTNITVSGTDNSDTPLTRAIQFKLTVLPVNDAPSAVTFSPDSIEENLYAGTFVGLIQVLDPDTGETFVYDMIAGDGVNDRDNDKFIITNDSLLSNAVFDYEEEDTLFIRLLVRDIGGLTSELSAQVYVIDTPDPGLAFSATTLSYGKIIIARSSEQTLTLTSSGTDTVMIDSISQVGAGYSMSSETYPIKIAPNLTKDFIFTFAPVDTGSSVDQAIFYAKYLTSLNQVILDGRGVYDTIPPIIATVPAITSSEAQEVLLTVPVVDENNITNVTLFYMVGGNPTINSQVATSNGDGTYSATISKDFTSILGLAYYYTAEDEYANMSTGDTVSVEVSYGKTRLDSKIAGTAYPNGLPKGKWRLISVPTHLDLSTVNETIGDELGETGDYAWKLYEDPGNANWQEAQDIKLGKGYWLNQRQEEALSFGVGSGKSVDIRSFTIQIPKGWSLIGNPYPFPVKVDFNDSEVFGPLTYGASILLGEQFEGWAAETTTLSPWEGYAVYNRTSDSLGLLINPLAQDTISSSAVTEGWHINLGVDNGVFSDFYNKIGRRAEASDKLDQWDNPEPPKLEQYLSLSMDRKAWDLESPLTSDIRSMNESNGQWDMYLDTKGIQGTVYLEANIKGDFPLESRAVLFDPIERKSYDLLSAQVIMITRINDHYDYPLNVLVGSPDYVLAKTEALIAQLPESFKLGQNYPNPFNPETNIPFTIAIPSYVQISVYNLLGQKVASLENRWFDMGQFNVRWNGKDAQGNQLSTGVYIYSLETAEFRQAKKLILVK